MSAMMSSSCFCSFDLKRGIKIIFFLFFYFSKLGTEGPILGKFRGGRDFRSKSRDHGPISVQVFLSRKNSIRWATKDTLGPEFWWYLPGRRAVLN